MADHRLFDVLMNGTDQDFWWDPLTLRDAGAYLPSAQEWGALTSYGKRQGINIFLWEKAVKDAQPDAPSLLPPRRSDTPIPSCPPLPSGAFCAASTAHAAPWLDAYIAYSQRASPRGLRDAHVAAGLWVLSTIAARRIVCQVGDTSVYPVLFLAMVARSTLFAKTSTANVGRHLLRRAGCGFFLTADKSTPQALIRSMSGIVPSSYGAMSEEQQTATQRRLQFAGQRGAYFEEWGGMLKQMQRAESPMAEFHTFLRVLDDHQESYTSETIQRGMESITNPYLAVLASATTRDLAPFMRPGSSWWHDGFWPRFAFITPQEDETPSRAHRERGGTPPPGSLIEPLHTWHTKLGIPSITIEAVMDQKGKPTGAWNPTVAPLPQRQLSITEAVYDAYEAYNDGLLTLLLSGDVPPDYDASYGRLHEKALRIALLLAGFSGDTMIEIRHWAYAQRIVEGWRRNLHGIQGQIAAQEIVSPAQQLEHRVEEFLGRVGQATAREIQRALWNVSSKEVAETLKNLEGVGVVVKESQGRTVRYGVIALDDNDTSFENLDVPF